MEHKSNIEKYDGNLKELAQDIGNLKYDALAEFLDHLSSKIFEDSKKDKKRGRAKLAESLTDASAMLDGSTHCIKNAWRISEPFMK